MARRPNPPLCDRPAARPRVAASANGVQHHGRVFGAILVLETSDVGGNGGFHGFCAASVSRGPTRRPLAHARKRHPRRGLRCRAALVRHDRIGRAMKRDHRHRPRVGAPAPWQELGTRHDPDRRDPIRACTTAQRPCRRRWRNRPRRSSTGRCCSPPRACRSDPR